MTNYERIKQMSVEDLAWELLDFRFDGFCKAKGAECTLPDSQDDIVKWLESEEEKCLT